MGYAPVSISIFHYCLSYHAPAAKSTKGAVCPLYVRRGDSRIAPSVSIITATNQKDQPPNFHVIARRAKPDVAIRIFPVPEGPGGALRRRGYGLPRRFAPRNDRGKRGGRSFCLAPAVLGERHGGRSLRCEGYAEKVALCTKNPPKSTNKMPNVYKSMDKQRCIC